jgi:hypothetical protein
MMEMLDGASFKNQAWMLIVSLFYPDCAKIFHPPATNMMRAVQFQRNAIFVMDNCCANGIVDLPKFSSNNLLDATSITAYQTNLLRLLMYRTILIHFQKDAT